MPAAASTKNWSMGTTPLRRAGPREREEDAEGRPIRVIVLPADAVRVELLEDHPIGGSSNGNESSMRPREVPAMR